MLTSRSQATPLLLSLKAGGHWTCCFGCWLSLFWHLWLHSFILAWDSMCCAELQEVYRHMSIFQFFSPLAFAEQAARFNVFSCKRHGANPKLCRRHFKLMVSWKWFCNTKCRSFDSSYEIVPMKQSRTGQLYYSRSRNVEGILSLNFKYSHFFLEWQRNERKEKKMNKHYQIC